MTSQIRHYMMDQVPFQVVGVEEGLYVLLHGISPSRTIQIRILMRFLSASPSTCNVAVALWVNGWPWWWCWLPTPSFQCNNTKTLLGSWCQTYCAFTHPSGYLLLSPPYSRPVLPYITQWHDIQTCCKEVFAYPRTFYWYWSHIRHRGTPISFKNFLISC